MTRVDLINTLRQGVPVTARLVKRVLERLEMPPGVHVSGLESDGAGLFYCGGGRSGLVRAVRRPARA